ncbi:MAG: segregation/condensation protein A [Candidatus Sericytochromatia bacterium]|nr:segregation/condensation protein A [Candidatus Sericytochromatia bacterium]
MSESIPSGPVPPTTTLAEENPGIEILLSMAQRGELDPWDVDIIEATDQVLAKLDATDRQDLRSCGRALHCATVMLRLKAHAIRHDLETWLAPPAEDDDWFDGPVDLEEGPADGPIIIDMTLLRRAGFRQPRRRKVTLGELIAELRRLEAEELPEPSRPGTLRRMRRADVKARTVGLVHDEDLDGDAKRLAEALAVKFETQPEISFRSLASTVEETPSLFLALMFLAHWGVVEVDQREPYADLSILAQEERPESHGQEAAA